MNLIQIIMTVYRRYPFEQKRLILAGAIGLLGLGIGIRGVVLGDLAAIHKDKALSALAGKTREAVMLAAASQAQVRSYQDRLSTSRQTDWMMQTVQRAAADTAISLVSVSPQGAEKDDDFEKNSLLVEADGGYHQVGAFVEKIENHKPWIFVSHLRLEKPAASAADKRLKVYMLLTAYREISGTGQ